MTITRKGQVLVTNLAVQVFWDDQQPNEMQTSKSNTYLFTGLTMPRSHYRQVAT